MDYVKVVFDETLCPKGEEKDYVDLLNGISWTCQNDGYVEGERNTIMVDFVVATTMLGLDPVEMLELFGRNNLITDDMDDEYPIARLHRIMDYDDKFGWSWMINPGDFVIKGSTHGGELTRVKFVLI